MTEQELNKACEWLDKRLEFYAVDAGCFNYERFFKDFRKAMSNSPEFEGISGNKEEIPPKYDADYLQSKIDAFTEARKKDGKTADEVLEECRGGALELTWQDIRKIAEKIKEVNEDENLAWDDGEDFYSLVLERFKEENK